MCWHNTLLNIEVSKLVTSRDKYGNVWNLQGGVVTKLRSFTLLYKYKWYKVLRQFNAMQMYQTEC